ncbi:hypothetical protein VNO78_25265 [Psophocarpus tetragonolobus]|uniref:MATH domain-containing protein n=1 Tax=Psophocarpus tetragonolobus TaxID=3891 RepID=A0AAN9XEX0_PSOTE
MENNNKRLKLMFEQYTWRITNFSKLGKEEVFSDKFINFDLREFDDDNICIFLQSCGDCTNLRKGCTKFVNVTLALINQLNDKMTIIKVSDSGKGFVVNDTCIIVAGIFGSKFEYGSEVDVSMIDNNPLSYVMSTTSFGELVDFEGLGKIERDFVPLLQEVCSKYPSLDHSLQKRSRRFTEWVFTTLGRVLHFLNTKRVKDMDDEACNHLQNLWDELQTSRFAFTWLQFHVESALAMKNHMEKAAQVRKMKENVAALEIETESLKSKMIEKVTELEIAKRDLVKAEEGFEERNLDAELGYGSISLYTITSRIEYGQCMFS